MRVLYIGVYRDITGYGSAARDYILALDAAGVDVVPRALKLSDSQAELPSRILELETRSSSGCDIVIQHILPHQMDYSGKFNKNIALFATETDNFVDSLWARRVNLMDEAWVINNQQVTSAKDSGITIPISVIPHATDISKFERSYEPLDIPQLKDTFVFYFIGETNRRKNLAALLKAFHLEFDRQEPVSLLLKIGGGPNQQEIQQNFANFADEIKRGLKLYGSIDHYKPEIVITEPLNEEHILRVHQTGNCFVAPSYGEAWCIPAFDALGMGRPVIASKVGGFIEYLNNDNGWLINGRWEPVFGMLDTFNNLYTSNENWYSIDINELRIAMREAYTNKELFKDKSNNARNSIYDFSHQKIGNLMKEKLIASS